MTEKRNLIDTLIERTGVDPYKLKRLSTDDLEQLVTAHKEGDERFDALYKEFELKDEEISQKEEVILEKEEALKPENYLSGRERVDREMADQVISLWNNIKTGRPKGKLGWIILGSLILLTLFVVTLFASIIGNIVNGALVSETQSFQILLGLIAVLTPIVLIYAWTLILGEGLDDFKRKEAITQKDKLKYFLIPLAFFILLLLFGLWYYNTRTFM